MIHIKLEISVARFYTAGSYDEKSPFDAVCTIHHLSDSEVYICGLHGVINREAWRELMDTLRNLGVSVVRFERHGKEKTVTLQRDHDEDN